MNGKISRYFFWILQKICEKVYGRGCKGGRVFMFHQVTDDQDTWIGADCAISKRGFEKFISALRDEGVVFGAIGELEEVGDDLKVFLTFDDIFADAVVHAIPYLIEKQIPFCVFVTENYIGKKNYVTAKQMKILLDEPLCTVGYHTKNHILMRGSNKKDIKREISCYSFAEKYYYQPTMFAYPYGSVYACNFYSMAEVKRQGYKYGFSTIAIPVTRRTVKYAKYFIPRININESNYTNYICGV